MTDLKCSGGGFDLTSATKEEGIPKRLLRSHLGAQEGGAGAMAGGGGALVGLEGARPPPPFFSRGLRLELFIDFA
jgi:hypothetical protein